MILHAIENLREAHGGPTFAAIGLACRQASAGESVAILCAEGPSSAPMRLELSGGGVRPRVELVEMGSPSAGAVADVLARLGPRIVHMHGIWDPVLRATVRACTTRQIPWVVSTHGMLHPVALSRRWLAKRAYLAAFCRIVRGARHVMALNREERAHVESGLRRPCTIVPGGVDVPEPAPGDDGAFRRFLPALGTRRFILFVGRLDRIKGIDRLLAAYGHAVSDGLDMDLVIAGPDFGEEASLRTTAAALGLGRRVHLCGPVWGRRKLEALGACSMFAHRPRYEGYGLAVVEAMAAGRPVVTTASCRADEAREAGVMVCAEDDDRSFADSLRSLADDPAAAEDLGRRARSWVIDRAAWPAIERRVDSVYSIALGAADVR